MWKLEQLWVKRDGNGVIVRLSDKPPQTEDFIPNVPMPLKRDPAQYDAKRKNSHPAG